MISARGRRSSAPTPIGPKGQKRPAEVIGHIKAEHRSAAGQQGDAVNASKNPSQPSLFCDELHFSKLVRAREAKAPA
ncbi:hypothetical protein AU467_21165 [Mesorhizobium loti]|uniref:Uncharacterized protein n=1 Tax=Rhizobium loti TaxID=381 RepID=A0A117N3S1_RHILI|nr:hypothetical protein AU467_21165 [Mesorhizobium loti]